MVCSPLLFLLTGFLLSLQFFVVVEAEALVCDDISDDPCMTEESLQACKELETIGCQIIGITETCPLTFTCNSHFPPQVPVSVCPGSSEPCMNEDNAKVCQELETEGCQNIGIMESCPLQFSCASYSTVQTPKPSKGGKKDKKKTKSAGEKTHKSSNHNTKCSSDSSEIVASVCIGECPRQTKYAVDEYGSILAPVTYTVPADGMSEHMYCLVVEYDALCQMTWATADVYVDNLPIARDLDITLNGPVMDFSATEGSTIQVNAIIGQNSLIQCIRGGSYSYHLYG